jgi:hypothetical protein
MSVPPHTSGPPRARFRRNDRASTSNHIQAAARLRARLIAAIVALAAMGLLTCACTTQSGSATPGATVTVTASPTRVATSTSGQPAAQATPIATSASASTAPPPASCLTRYLGATVGVSQGTAGSTYIVLVFKNLDNHPCTLYGYPGVAQDAGVPVTQVGLAAARDPASPRELVTLGPYGTASALLRIAHAGNYPPAACQPVTTQWLQVIPPNQYVPIYLGYTSQTCAKPVQLLTVDAVRPGTGSS